MGDWRLFMSKTSVLTVYDAVVLLLQACFLTYLISDALKKLISLY